MQRLAVFVSGHGSNLRSIHAAATAGDIPAEVALVVTDKPDCPAAGFAGLNGIDVLHFPAPGVAPQALSETFQQLGIDIVLLAGYLQRVPAELVRAYPRAMLNIHPALLPAFGGFGYYGRRVHEAVIASGVKYSGVTVHFVDEDYDHGPIVAQAVVPVHSDDTPDTLAARVLEQEHLLYPRVVAAVCAGKVSWRDHSIPSLEVSF